MNQWENPADEKYINCKNLSICRLLLLSSSSSWDFCWMQSTHIENGSGGILYHFFKCPTFTFVYNVYYFFGCSIFDFFKSAFSPLTLFTSCFLLFTTLIFHQFCAKSLPSLSQHSSYLFDPPQSRLFDPLSNYCLIFLLLLLVHFAVLACLQKQTRARCSNFYDLSLTNDSPLTHLHF